MKEYTNRKEKTFPFILGHFKYNSILFDINKINLYI